MKTLALLISILCFVGSAVAQNDTTLSCNLTIVQQSGATLDKSSVTPVKDFFSFVIDPILGATQAWSYQNRCLSKGDISGAKYKGRVCLQIYNSGPTQDGKPQTLYVDIGQYLRSQLLSKKGLQNLPANRATTLVLPFPSRAFSVQLSAQSGGVSLIQLQCG